MRPIRLKKNRRSDRFMFTDKSHSMPGIFSCVLGASGLFALVFSIVRIFTAGGQVQTAQSISLVLCVLYGLAGAVTGIVVLIRRDSFPLFPGIGVALNTLLLLCVAGLLVWGNLL